MSKIQELIDHLKSHFPEGVHLVLAGEAKHELAESCAAELATNNRRHELELRVKQLEAKLEARAETEAELRGELAAKSAEGAKESVGANGGEKCRMERKVADLKVLIGKLLSGIQLNPPLVDCTVQELHALLAKMEDEHQTLATAAQGYMDRAAKLEAQRDQVQRELDSTIDQLLHANNECKDLSGLFVERGRKLNRMGEALTAAEKDLADLRWLVRGAREGATLRAAPMLVLSTTGPATAQAEGGAK